MYLFYSCLCCSQVHNLLVFSYSDHKHPILPPLISQALLCRFSIPFPFATLDLMVKLFLGSLFLVLNIVINQSFFVHYFPYFMSFFSFWDRQGIVGINLVIGLTQIKNKINWSPGYTRFRCNVHYVVGLGKSFFGGQPILRFCLLN